MDNQHRQIKGYRELSAEEIALMNEGKELAEKVGAYLDKLKRVDIESRTVSVDGRWLAIGTTDLQKGFMAVVRAITRPTSF